MEASEQTGVGGTGGRSRVARVAALVLGVVFVGASVTMTATQDRFTWLQFTPLLDGIEWALGTVLLLSAAAGESVARTVLRVAGVLLVVAAIAATVARTSMGDWLGFTEGVGLPGSQAAWFGLSGVAALAAGFASRGRAGA